MTRWLVLIETMRPSPALLTAALLIELEVRRWIWRLSCCDLRGRKTFPSFSIWKLYIKPCKSFPGPAILWSLGCSYSHAKLWNSFSAERLISWRHSAFAKQKTWLTVCVFCLHLYDPLTFWSCEIYCHFLCFFFGATKSEKCKFHSMTHVKVIEVVPSATVDESWQ